MACPLFKKELIPYERKTGKAESPENRSRKKLIAAQPREKQQEYERRSLMRSERTHQFCICVGILEKFLREPALLADNDVMKLSIFFL